MGQRAVGRAVRMGMRFDERVRRYQHDPPVPDPAFGDHMIGKVLHLVGLAAKDRHFEAAVAVEVRMHRGERQFVVIVEGVGEPLR